MRSVTFSNKDVAKFINENFVATWVNRNKHFHSCSLEAEVDIAEQKGEAFPTRNFAVFFTTPDKQVLHGTVGYYNAHWFLPEANLALAVWREGYDEDMKRKPGAADAVAKLHNACAKQHSDQAKKVMALKMPAGCERPAAFASTKDNLRDGLSALRGVHGRVSRGFASGYPLPLKEATADYGEGNLWQPITEQ